VPPEKSMTDRAIQYVQSVLLGEILSGPIVRAACQRHLNDLKSVGERGFYYDEKKATDVKCFY